MSDDTHLRRQFASLRRAEAASTPSFQAVIGDARRRPRDARWGLAIAAGIVMTAIGGLILRTSQPPEAAIPRARVPELADWRAPTDFLLDTPGRELLQTIPDFGRRPAAGIDPSPPIGITISALRAGLEHS
jgi:hypothetical protein